ncbi:MAG: primase C-terminal domain-containing protein, partial [Cetobacterium sp.]|uniref:primase C-terminal domain-containing protein n=1 Tax=Cetobacterium sp. TaxID=2071632 RepID=UPI003EE637AF
CKKTLNGNRSFFRIQVSYFLAKMAASMRATLVTLDRGELPVNVYAINLAPSGSGKGHSTNIIENDFLTMFKNTFLNETFPHVAQQNLIHLAAQRASSNGTDADEELLKLEKEFDSTGELAFSFDSGTVPALKQLRHKLLMANAGAASFECDEIGKNLISNAELLTSFLELYDQGLIKQKLTKNTAESQRAKEVFGKTPANVLMFGNPNNLLNGAKEEDEFNSFLEGGYARRCFFGDTSKADTQQEMTPEQIFDMLTDSTSSHTINRLSQHFGMLADEVKFGQKIMVSKEVSIRLIAYKLHCEQLADKLPEHEEIQKAELRHRYFKALKLAGVYAFVDESHEVTMDQLMSAILIAEDSGESFTRIFKREKNYVKLARYIATVGKDVTHVDLVEDLPFYKGSNAQKNELMNLAVAYGHKNHIIIKKFYVDGIEFFRGESLKPVDLNQLVVSYSDHVAYNYLSEKISLENLSKLCSMSGMHWVNHGLLKGDVGDGHRDGANVCTGFDLIVIDVDGGASLDEVRVLMKDYTYLIHTTKRHTDEAHRFRLILPMNYHLKLDEQEFKEFMSNLFEWLPFKVDEQTSQRCRKWECFDGHVFTNDGELFDALPFIPKTSKNDAFKKTLVDLGNLDNLERWFAQRMGSGNRNNQLLKFAMLLADTGMDYQNILDRVLGFNAKLDTPLPEIEIHSTIMRSISKKLSEK